MTLLSFATTVEEGIAVVSLEGELDVAGAELLEQELARIGGDPACRGLVLDLSRLEFMDSTGLRLVVLADARARENGRPLVLVRAGESVQRVFEMTRMDDRLRFEATASDAVQAARQGGGR